jgi:putative endonuclease
MPYYVYILYSERSDKYYIGHTENYKARLWSHNNSERTNYTSSFRPWIIAACFEAGVERGDAIKIEKKLKNLKSKVRLKKIIEGEEFPDFLSPLIRLSLNNEIE